MSISPGTSLFPCSRLRHFYQVAAYVERYPCVPGLSIARAWQWSSLWRALKPDAPGAP
ncbi:MAG: hypothetical protein U1D30_22830 [Planctomycetota bacterium]